jgi:hypothetical protein
MHEFKEMVDIVENWFHKDTDENKKEFLETSQDKLVKYHTTLGRSIRNEFKLWDREWKSDVRDGVDYSPDHPDQLSMRVIKEVWLRVQNS